MPRKGAGAGHEPAACDPIGQALQAPPYGPPAAVAVATGLPDGPSLRSGSGRPTDRHHRPMTSTHTPSPPATTTAAATPTRGQRVELARYDTDTGVRVLVGQRIDGTVRVFHEPTANGPTFEVEAGLDSKAALDALITDYLAKAKRIGYPPMHGWF